VKEKGQQLMKSNKEEKYWREHHDNDNATGQNIQR
jgi:hypothetical protein